MVMVMRVGPIDDGGDGGDDDGDGVVARSTRMMLMVLMFVMLRDGARWASFQKGNGGC